MRSADKIMDGLRMPPSATEAMAKAVPTDVLKGLSATTTVGRLRRRKPRGGSWTRSWNGSRRRAIKIVPKSFTQIQGFEDVMGITKKSILFRFE